MPQKEKVVEHFLAECQTALASVSLTVDHSQGNEQAFLRARPAPSIRDSGMRGFQADCAVESPGISLFLPMVWGLPLPSLSCVPGRVQVWWQGLFLLPTSAVHLALTSELPHREGRAWLHGKDPLS